MRNYQLNDFGTHNLAQFIVYAKYGLILNLIGYLLYLALTESGISPFISVSITYPLGILLSYYFHSRYTFEHKGTRNEYKSISKYTFIYVTGYLLNIIVLYFLHNTLQISHKISQIIAVIIAPFYFFLCNKYWVFKR